MSNDAGAANQEGQAPNAGTEVGGTTQCLNCGKTIEGSGPAVCAECQQQGLQVCEYCGIRVSNGTTPYCNQCAEEIVGTA